MKKLILALATGCAGLVAGVFYGFEVAVNPAFQRLPDAGYVAAMRAINEVIQNPWFALGFFGAPLLLPLAAALHRGRPRRAGRFGLLTAAAAIYLAGSFGVTVAANIPLNDALATVPLAATPARLSAARRHFAEPWNRWHRVRTLASVLAFGLAVAACLRTEATTDES